MQIEVVSVDVVNKGKYREANVTYKDSNGKVDAKKKIMSFTFKDVFKAISEAKQGDKFNVTLAKNDKGYWDWTEVGQDGKNTGEAPSKKFEAVSKNTYETAEERARKQVYIVRQSSITAALGLADRNGFDTLTEEDIIKSARRFETYVFDTAVRVAEAEVS